MVDSGVHRELTRSSQKTEQKPNANNALSVADELLTLESNLGTEPRKREGAPAPAPLREGKKNIRTSIDPNWRPNDGNIAFAKSEGLSQKQIDGQAASLVDWSLENDYRTADWDRRWQIWVRKAVKMLNIKPARAFRI